MLFQAHIQAHIVEIFIRKLTSEEEDEFPPAAKVAVMALCKMYALDLIAKNAGDFLEVSR